MRSNDPDINNEPHRQLSGLPTENLPRFDPAIDPPLGFDSKVVEFSLDSEQDIDHSVWDEPSLATQLTGQVPESALTYASWLASRTEAWTQGNAWATTLGIASLSIPCAAIAAIVSWTMGNIFVVSDILVACLVGPVVQEICKIVVPLWVVEKRPYFFTGWFQFFVIAMVTALSFSVVSNLFLSFAIEATEIKIEPVKQFAFQWVGVLGLNLITATVAGFGLEKIWKACVRSSQPPQLGHGYPFFATAIGLHVIFSIGSTIWIFTCGHQRLFAF